MILSQKLYGPIEELGSFTLFVMRTLRVFGRVWNRKELFFRQCDFIGVSSTLIITISAIFLGGVLGYQLYVSLHLFGAEALLGGSVGVALFRELAPVMASIMVTGRAGAAMAAEIASMRITEQIDALEVMAVDPIEYLVLPRVLAGVLMLPLIGIFFAVVASMAACGVSSGLMGLSYATYWSQFTRVVDTTEILHCIVKSACFGLIITWIGCYCGYVANGGARAVGLATRMSVVASCLAILLGDYILTSLLPFGFAKFVM